VPALCASHCWGRRAFTIASAICDRHELPVHKKSTFDLMIFSSIIAVFTSYYPRSFTPIAKWSLTSDQHPLTNNSNYLKGYHNERYLPGKRSKQSIKNL
jgi:hypothetical protein